MVDPFGQVGVEALPFSREGLLTAIMAGLLPILWSNGNGSEVMRRIAVPMVGGMVSSTLLTLLVIPVLYAIVKGRGLPYQTGKPPLAQIRATQAAE